ncbi:hypothetical protein DFH08DRAFT_801755 [Mycena albidolilacea]|uniref:Uncharacterized protein n=1 Tax=Mycena albidolilacea TaxID=1033008 RepID=A0AAD7AG70_9AGAR|nr:hypothetical protein DFH08DRAFT_801755 [Mycena albidolilacea]
MKKGTWPKPASPLAADQILRLDRSVLPLNPTSLAPDSQAEARAETAPAPSPPTGLPRTCTAGVDGTDAPPGCSFAQRGEVDMKWWGWAGAAHFLVLVGRPARAACAYERLQGPGTSRDSARWWRILRWREVFRFCCGGCDIVRLKGREAPLNGRGMAEPDGVGKRSRGEECGAAPSLDNKAAPAHDR